MSELKEKVLSYVMETPENTNIAVLASIIDANEVQPAPVTKVKPSQISFKGIYDSNTTDLSSLDWSKLTSTAQMFYGNYFTSLDLSEANTSTITNMSEMFRDSTRLTSLDVSSFDTSKVTTMANMFQSCANVERIIGLEKFEDTLFTDSNGSKHMFDNCKKLKEIRLPNFTNPLGISCFSGCITAELIDISGITDINFSSNDNIFGSPLDATSQVPATCQIYVNNQQVKEDILELCDWFGTGENIHIGAPTE